MQSIEWPYIIVSGQYQGGGCHIDKIYYVFYFIKYTLETGVFRSELFESPHQQMVIILTFKLNHINLNILRN